MTIAFANHKGGTGKTTTVLNMGRVLSGLNRRILLVDLDPQANLSYSVGLDKGGFSFADYILKNCEWDEIIRESEFFDVIVSSSLPLQKRIFHDHLENSEFLLSELLTPIRNNYDYILLDCPPAISCYTLNALNAADGVIIPILLEALSVQGMHQIIEEIYRIQNTTNPNLEILGVLGVIVHENRNLTGKVLEYVRDNYYVNVFNNHVRSNVKAAEAPFHAVSVVDYAPGSTSARDYSSVTNEFLNIVKQEI